MLPNEKYVNFPQTSPYSRAPSPCSHREKNLQISGAIIGLMSLSWSLDEHTSSITLSPLMMMRLVKANRFVLLNSRTLFARYHRTTLYVYQMIVFYLYNLSKIYTCIHIICFCTCDYVCVFDCAASFIWSLEYLKKKSPVLHFRVCRTAFMLSQPVRSTFATQPTNYCIWICVRFILFCYIVEKPVRYALVQTKFEIGLQVIYISAVLTLSVLFTSSHRQV